MTPYFNLTTISFGPVNFQVWGLFVASGFLISLTIIWNLLKKEKMRITPVWDFFILLALLTIIFARLFYVFFGGDFFGFLKKPWLFFAFWQGGMASMGGFFGAGIAILWFWKKIKENYPGAAGKIFRRHLEIMAYSFPFGWLFGRLGCYLVNDHPGRLTSSFLGTDYPGGARWDMGLLEIAAILPLAIFFLIMPPRQKKFSPFFHPLWLALWYGSTRFFLDFLRAGDLPSSDLRYLSLTLGQWGSIILVLLGVFFLKKRRLMSKTAPES